MKQRTLGHFLMHVAIGCIGLVLAAGVGAGLRAKAIDDIATEVAKRTARETEILQRAQETRGKDDAAKDALMTEAAGVFLADILDPVSTSPWRSAAFFSFAAMAVAALAGTFWASSRTGMWQAGVCVGVVAVLAWIAMVWAGHAKLESLPEVTALLTGAIADAGRRTFASTASSRMTRQIFVDARLDWSILVKASFLFAGVAWAGTKAGTKAWAAGQSRHLYAPVGAGDSFMSEQQPVSVPQEASSSARVDSERRPVATSWDPLASTVFDGPAGTVGSSFAVATPPSPTGETAENAGLGHTGLCPQCGAVNGPANRSCVMCETVLAPSTDY